VFPCRQRGRQGRSQSFSQASRRSAGCESWCLFVLQAIREILRVCVRPGIATAFEIICKRRLLIDGGLHCRIGNAIGVSPMTCRTWVASQGAPTWCLCYCSIQVKNECVVFLEEYRVLLGCDGLESNELKPVNFTARARTGWAWAWLWRSRWLAN
jgi:hypothetical protein